MAEKWGPIKLKIFLYDESERGAEKKIRKIVMVVWKYTTKAGGVCGVRQVYVWGFLVKTLSTANNGRFFLITLNNI